MLFFFSQIADINFLICGFEPLVRRTNICLQVEELATLEFHWLEVGEVSTYFCQLHRHFTIIQSNYFFVFRWNCFSKMPDVGVNVTPTRPYVAGFRRILLSVVKVSCP